MPRMDSEAPTGNSTAEEHVSESEVPEEGEPKQQPAEKSESSPTASPKGSEETSTTRVDDEATEIEAELMEKEFVPKKSAILSSVENLPFVGKSKMSLDGNKIGKLSSNSGSRQTNDNSEPTNQKDPVEAETRRSKAFDNRVVELRGEETEESTSPPTPPNL